MVDCVQLGYFIQSFEGWMGLGEAIGRGNKSGFHVKHSRLDGVEQGVIYKGRRGAERIQLVEF